MKLLDKRDMGIIYAIKTASNGDIKKNIINFMCHYSDSEPEAYTDYTIFHLVQHAFAAVMDTVDYPSGLVSSYFRWKCGPWHYDDFDAMCAVLGCELPVQHFNYTTKQYEYINGFTAMEEFK